MLEVLLAAGGAVVSSEELLERVWDENADPFTTTVRVTVMTLRKKLGDPGVIETVVGCRLPGAGRGLGRVPRIMLAASAPPGGWGRPPPAALSARPATPGTTACPSAAPAAIWITNAVDSDPRDTA